jgi:superfamily I DNA/RNA helicase
VIAISYTNKASTELRQRVKQGGTDTKASFFGTIDRFFISEIIIPFGRRIWGNPPGEIRITTALDVDVPHTLRLGDRGKMDGAALRAGAEELGRLYAQGIIVLEAVGFMASEIFAGSTGCRRYLRARYTDVFVDEYQDSGEWQHALFLGLVGEGIRGVAVGDLDQSIFTFADKFPRFLRALTEGDRFVEYHLTINHRCHPAIAQYAAKFLSARYIVPPGQEKRVFHIHLHGSEREIGRWLNTAVPEAMAKFDVEIRNQVGILVRNNRTAELILDELKIPYRFAATTPLDEENSPASAVFRSTLTWLFNSKVSRRGFLEEHLDSLAPKITQRRLIHLLSELQGTVPFGATDREIEHVLELMLAVGEITTARKIPQRAISCLTEVLRNGDWIHFAPAATEEVQVMTIFKAKGLEFDIVFHLDLYQYILPKYKREDEPEEANLHYVGLTRAKYACILCTSTLRHNYQNQAVAAEVSPFLNRNGLPMLREEW